MKKSDEYSIILHKMSPDSGCQEERLIFTVPRWNFDLEKRYREHHFEPFVRAAQNVEDKDLFDWIRDSFNWTKGKQVVSRK